MWQSRNPPLLTLNLKRVRSRVGLYLKNPRLLPSPLFLDPSRFGFVGWGLELYLEVITQLYLVITVLITHL